MSTLDWGLTDEQRMLREMLRRFAQEEVAPLARELDRELGVVQHFTPSCDALFVPNIDEALDEEDAKRDFWAAFRVLGDWYAELPPY